MIQQQEEQPVRISINDLIYAQQKDLGKRMDRLEVRMDKLETRIEKLSERMDKQDEKMDKLSDKIEALRRDLMNGSNHEQIATISTIGIALAVIYSVLR